jgi:hypothetical protein
MQNRGTLRDFYCFLHNGANEYYSASYDAVGLPIISKDFYPNQKPLDFNPSNLKDVQITFGTNKNYFAGTRSVLISWNFIGDGAEIVRYIKYTGTGYAAELYILLIRYDPSVGIYKKYYEGRLDLAKAKDIPLIGYSVPCIDLSCWGILAQNEGVRYQIDCTPQNPKAIPILFDGITLQSRYTWQPVPGDNKVGFAVYNMVDIFLVIPIVLANTDGDSFGLITQDQQIATNQGGNITNIFSFVELGNFFFVKATRPIQINVVGSITFDLRLENQWPVTNGTFIVQFIDQNGNSIPIVSIPLSNQLNVHKTYSFTISNIIDIDEGQSWALMGTITGFRQYTNQGEDIIHINFSITNIIMSVKSVADASIVYGLRPLDVLQEIVSRATNNKYTANSNYFALNNKLVLTCGNALRNAPNAYIVSSFQDFFKSYNTERWLAFRIIQNQIWIEPAEIVYDDTPNLFELNEVKNIEIEDALDYLINEVQVGTPNQDYRHTSGRLEFNTTNTFSIYQFNIRNTLSLVTVFRKDCYGMEFIRLDYQQQSTKDNSGDDSVFMVDITDTVGSAGSEAENFVSFDVDATPLAPLIYYPFNNDSITNDKPVIRGACQPNAAFNIYVDGSLDGSTSSDDNGYYTYNIQTSLTPYIQDVQIGVHTIDVTFTDETGTLNSVTVNILTGTTAPNIEYPKNKDSLYNNKPIIKGFLQAGQTLPLILDGQQIANVTGDGNCRWTYTFGLFSPMSNGQHLLTIGSAFSTFNVNSFTDIPLITKYQIPYDAIDGFTSVEQLPLIEGVAAPNTKVDLYLDYYPDVSLGTTFSNETGNWRIQILEMFQSDNITPLTPIPNGNHILSTSLDILSTKISVNGFTLNRPAYDNISGVIDNTVFNAELTPMHNMINRMNYWKSIFYQQPDTVIKFETGTKNQSFSTTINGITTKENNNITISQFQGTPLFLPYIVNFTTETPFSFVDTIDNFNKGGLVKFSYQGNILYGLPIGKMVVEDVTRDVQKWSLLVSAKTSLQTLLNLSNQGQTFNLMSNSIYHSDYNTLHFVMYNFQAPDMFDQQPELYEDWFMNRNNRWVNNPEYIQKVQRTDTLIDQIIVNSVTGSIFLNMHRCKDGTFVQTFTYTPVTPAPIPAPDIVLQCNINLTNTPDGEYFFTLLVGGVPCAISERITVADRWYGTIYIDSGNSVNKTGAIFSNGWRSQFRVEGLVEKYVGGIESIINEDEEGNFDVLHAISTKRKTVLFGSGTGIPDYLYLKIVSAIILDDLKIQGVYYVISKNSRVEPVDKIPGYPMYYYSVDFDVKQDQNGHAFDAGEGTFRNNVILVVDAGAFGLGGGQLSEIELD